MYVMFGIRRFGKIVHESTRKDIFFFVERELQSIRNIYIHIFQIQRILKCFTKLYRAILISQGSRSALPIDATANLWRYLEGTNRTFVDNDPQDAAVRGNLLRNPNSGRFGERAVNQGRAGRDRELDEIATDFGNLVCYITIHRASRLANSIVHLSSINITQIVGRSWRDTRVTRCRIVKTG